MGQSSASIWSGKTSAITGLSVIEQYHRFYHKAVSVFIGVILIVIIIPVEAFTGVVIGHSLSFMFPSLSPIWWTAICFAVVVVLYIFTGGFRWVVLLCTVLVAFMTLTFFVNAIVVGPDVGKLARGLVVPWLPAGREGTLLFVGILGGSAGIIGMLFYGYTVRNAGWTKQGRPGDGLGQYRLHRVCCSSCSALASTFPALRSWASPLDARLKPRHRWSRLPGPSPDGCLPSDISRRRSPAAPPAPSLSATSSTTSSSGRLTATFTKTSGSG